MIIKRKKRYSHIYIGLQVQIHNKWEQIKALDWHEEGLNFYIDHDIDTNDLLFKKGLDRFSGTIAWRRVINDEHVLLEMILNRFLVDELDKMDTNDANYQRILKLIRTHGKQEEKEKLLILMKGMSIVKDALSILEKYKIEKSLYRFGVKIVSDKWTKIVDYALKTSSVVQVLDNIEKEISKISDEI
jgi:hypothetical protein